MRFLGEIHRRSMLCVPRKINHIFTARKQQPMRLLPGVIIDTRDVQPFSIPYGMRAKDLVTVATINDSLFFKTQNTDRANCRFATSDNKESAKYTNSCFPDTLLSGTDDRRRKSHGKDGKGSD